ncbi:hypothetical protein [Mesorhizobium sp.]|uniref:hypothetical protein n=1 Tax=Mesorhizobium sp. TaxID=1871066 RepID=UPI0025DEF55C|nr:hypothetical protein [Mesorhizobium sp.]
MLPTATAAFAERIVGMTRRIPPDSSADAPAVTHSFGSEIASLLRHHLPRAGALGLPTVSVSCSDGAVALYGKIDFGDTGAPSLRYRDVSPGVDEAVAGGCWPAAKRVSFPPSSLVGLGDVLNEGSTL